MVRQRSAKPLSAGSIPAVASNISTPPGFAFAPTVESHGWFHLAPFRWSAEERVLRRKERLGNRVADLEISHDGEALQVRGAADSDELRRRIARMFQLHVDLTDFHALARMSERHAWVTDRGFGRLLCGTTLWEDAVKVITTTNTMWRQTKRMVELLVETCGRGGAFPTQAEVLRFTPEELQERCRLGYRAKTIHALASVDLTTFGNRDAPTEQLYKQYLTLPGIGPYGAAHLLAMDGRHDRIAVDTEFRRHVRDTYHAGRTVSDKAMLRHYARWGRWKYLGYWSELWAGHAVAAPLQPGADGDT